MFNIDSLKQPFASQLHLEDFRDNRRIVVPSQHAFSLLTVLKTDFGFNYLTDITAVDYLEWENATDRFAVVYCLLNLDSGERLVVKTFVNDPDPSLPSVIG